MLINVQAQNNTVGCVFGESEAGHCVKSQCLSRILVSIIKITYVTNLDVIEND